MIKRFKCSKCGEKFTQHIEAGGYAQCPECESRDVMVHKEDYQSPDPIPPYQPNTDWTYPWRYKIWCGSDTSSKDSSNVYINT